jgi:DNA gyrase subunit B
LGNHTVHVRAQIDPRTDKPLLRIERSRHGNVKLSTIDADFAHGADYAPIADFRAAMAWLMAEAENQVTRQRYKGLGEMNPEQLWETTMDPAVRRLLRVQIEDAIGAGQCASAAIWV